MIQHMFLSNENFKGRFDRVSRTRQDEKGMSAAQLGTLYVTNFRVIFDPDNKDLPKVSLEWGTKICRVKYNTKANKAAIALNEQYSKPDPSGNMKLESVLEIFGFDNAQDFTEFNNKQKSCFNSDTQSVLGSSIAKDYSECMPLAKVRKTATKAELNKGTSHASIHESLYIADGEIPTAEKRKVIFSVYPALEESYKTQKESGKAEEPFWRLYRSNFCLKSRGTMDQDFIRFTGQPLTASEALQLKRQAFQADSEFNIFNDAGEFSRSKFATRTPTSLEFSGNYNRTADGNEIHKRFEEKKALAAGWCPINRQSGLSVNPISKTGNGSTLMKSNSGSKNSNLMDMDDDELCMLDSQKEPGFEHLSLTGSALPLPSTLSTFDNSTDVTSGSNSPPAFAIKRPAGADLSRDPSAYKAMDQNSLFRTMESSIESTENWAKIMAAADSTAIGQSGSTTENLEELKKLEKLLIDISYHKTIARFWDYVNDEKFKSNANNSFITKIKELEEAIRLKKMETERVYPKMKMAYERVLEPLVQANRIWTCIKQIYQI